MTPTRLSQRWSHRLYTGLLIASILYIGLYALRMLRPALIPDTLTIDLVAVSGAGVVAGISLVLLIAGKKIQSPVPLFIAYGLFLLTTAYLVQQTGGVWSVFIPIWALALFIAPLFGALGWLPALVLMGGYFAGVYLDHELNPLFMIAVIVSSVVPLGIGVFTWSQAADAEETSTTSVTKLTNRLSEVATQSEIVINAIGDGVIAVDGQGVVQLINPAAQEILGWGKHDAIALNYKSIFNLSDETGTELNPALDPIQQVLNTNQQARGNKLVAVTKSSKKVSLSIVVSPIGGPGAGAIIVFRDITKERAEEREQAEFISTASHEMRTPVASIEGYLGLAMNPTTATVDPRAADFIKKAHEAAQHLGRLFQDLLDVSKSDDGRMTNIPKVVDLVPFTQTIVEGLAQKAVDKGLSLTFVPLNAATSSSQRKIMPVYFTNVDNDHLREILDNLIENAIKYTPKGEVRVDISGSDDTVVISIKDTGLGIPAEDVNHLFQKFYRVNNIDRQEIGGTGLGLYLSRRLVEAMQGRLWVESVFEHGSTFFVELPRVDSQRAAQLKEEQAHQAAQQAATTLANPNAANTANGASAGSATNAASAGSAATFVPPITANDVTYTTLPAVPQAATVAPQVVSSVAVSAPAVAPATTVPRGEALSREQIQARARQLEALAQQQRNNEQSR